MTRYLTATPEAGMAYVSPVALLQEVSVTHSVCMVLHCLSGFYLLLAQITGINDLSALASRRCSSGPEGQARPDRWKAHLTTVLKNAPNFFSDDLRGI